ncbi:hypothetical protein AMTRI_Chr03g56580 [Amborella trichopoda]
MPKVPDPPYFVSDNMLSRSPKYRTACFPEAKCQTASIFVPDRMLSKSKVPDRMPKVPDHPYFVSDCMPKVSDRAHFVLDRMFSRGYFGIHFTFFYDLGGFC